jgi:3-deoxy-manno-octulosonate cytidylyltransferase (CMP-KDO synthetase)
VNHTDPNPPLNPKTKAVAIIPARYDSVRLPGKALLEIAGKPMICWVVERALAAANVARAIVATDDKRIVAAVRSAGYEAMMTSTVHRSGTDRIAEVARSLDDAEVIVNVQGDEPLISPETIERAVEAIGEEGKGDEGKDAHWAAEIVTTWEPIASVDEVLSPDVVKIVVDASERGIYFSRSPVPYPRDAVQQHGTLKSALEHRPGLLATFRKHTGLYVYRRDALLQFAEWPQSELERQESLEQLRALEHGMKIRAIKASSSSIGVDTMADLERVRGEVSSFECRVPSFKFQVSSPE